VLLPVLQFEQQIVHYRTVGLVFNWNFQSPLVVAPADVDLVVAILDNETVDFFATKVNKVSGLASGFFAAGPVSLHENEIRKNRCRDDEQDQCRFPLHDDSTGSLGAPFPPNSGAENDKDKRHQDEDHPTQ